MASVYDVAQYINEQFYRLTKVKLQKLLYFCQAWYLAKNKRPLFQEDFYAWKLGPVVKELHEMMRDGENLVPTIITGADIHRLINNEALYIDKVLHLYGDMTKEELVDKSHEDDPWKNSMLDALITKESIMHFYEGKPCPIQ